MHVGAKLQTTSTLGNDTDIGVDWGINSKTLE